MKTAGILLLLAAMPAGSQIVNRPASVVASIDQPRFSLDIIHSLEKDFDRKLDAAGPVPLHVMGFSRGLYLPGYGLAKRRRRNERAEEHQVADIPQFLRRRSPLRNLEIADLAVRQRQVDRHRRTAQFRVRLRGGLGLRQPALPRDVGGKLQHTPVINVAQHDVSG